MKSVQRIHISDILKLALPAAAANAGQMAMGWVDLLFVGRIPGAGAEAIAAVGLGHSVFAWFLVFGFGLLSGLDYHVAFSHGSGDLARARRSLGQGLHICWVLGSILTLCVVGASLLLDSMSLNREVTQLARGYVQLLALSLLPTLGFAALRFYLQARGEARAALWIIIGANVVNLVANNAWVMGRWGAPALGINGSAWATIVSRFFAFGALFLFWMRWERAHKPPLRLKTLGYDAKLMRELVSLGFPAGLQMLLEVGVFAFATVLAAKFSAQEMAAHQIVLNFASMTFMVPLGLSGAGAVLVGQQLGRGKPILARRAGWLTLGLSLTFMGTSSLLMLLFPNTVLGIYTPDPSVLATAGSLIWLAGLFQLADGAQVTGTGILRGAGDTRGPMVMNLLGHWCIGLPMGLYLGFARGMRIQGLWIGLSLGLFAVALGVLWRWVRRDWKKTLS